MWQPKPPKELNMKLVTIKFFTTGKTQTLTRELNDALGKEIGEYVLGMTKLKESPTQIQVEGVPARSIRKIEREARAVHAAVRFLDLVAI
jgi:hypothetical protein